MQRSKFLSGGKELELYTWEVKNPCGVLQIIHGMAEHLGRYDDFASYMNENGFIVIGFDSRCHGYTDKNNLGYSEGNIWEDTLNDCIALSSYIKEKYGLFLTVMGHSYGSFLTQRLIQTNRYADAFILSGSCYMKGLELDAGYFIAKALASKNRKKPAKILYNITFGSYNKKFRGNAAWLSRNEQQVALYNQDDMCGFCCSAGFYESFFKGLKSVYKSINMSQINKDTPLLIFSGDEDPVGKNGKGVRKLYKMYTSNGVEDVTLKLYDGGRHEMLNEINNLMVYKNISSWISMKSKKIK